MTAIKPTDILPSYALDGTDITIPIASLGGLSTAEANATTGDGREVLKSILNTSYSQIQEMSSGDRPTKMTIDRSPLRDIGSGLRRVTYTVNFDMIDDVTLLSLASE